MWRDRGGKRPPGWPSAPLRLDLNAVMGSDWVSLGGGEWLPLRMVVHLDDPARPLVATLTFDLDRSAARYRCTRVEAEAREEGDELTADDLRLPVASIVAAATRTLGAFTGGPDAPEGTLKSELEREQGAPVPGWASSGRGARETLRDRRRLPDEHLDEVADLYRKAVKDGRSPRRVISQHFFGHEDNTLTARRWIQAARRRGLLGKSMHGKAGEAPPEGGGDEQGGAR